MLAWLDQRSSLLLRLAAWVLGVLGVLGAGPYVGKNKGLPPGAEIKHERISVGPSRWATDDVLSPPRFRTRALKTDATALDGLGESKWTAAMAG